MNRIQIGNHITAIFKFRWLAGIILILMIDVCTYAAFVSSGSSANYINNQDKILHALAFCALFVVGYISLNFDLFPRIKKLSPQIMIVTWLALAGYGLFIELVQSYLTYRDSSKGDLIADLVGLTIGAVVVVFFRLHPKAGDSPVHE